MHSTLLLIIYWLTNFNELREGEIWAYHIKYPIVCQKLY